GVGIGYVDFHAANGMLPEIADIEAAIGANTRAVAIVSPNNPCGSIYPPELLDEIFSLCKARGIWLILDETYRDFLPEADARPHGLLARDGWQDTLVQEHRQHPDLRAAHPPDCRYADAGKPCRLARGKPPAHRRAIDTV
ncbi:MAG: aminotransferase class I/II-fold pyridoxal phosphate-dependent enzyme, partial [Pseudomonadota bacterium]|nr:aminotransferase class I/II-fold pyridoxal phosphate-dependent enzyme [Pseudomonadota bacterium]